MTMKLSALVLTKNEEEMIEKCLTQLKFADEIIVLDQNSEDKTAEIARRYTNKVITSNSQDFDKNRQILKEAASGQWLLYVDADERLSEELIREIKNKISNDDFAAYLDPQSRVLSLLASLRLRNGSKDRGTKTAECSAFYFPRKNIVLGKWLKHGGWWPDYVPRLFKKDKLITWKGWVHESPQVIGQFGYLKTPIEHYTARNLTKMLEKSINWAQIEARLFLKTSHPNVTVFHLIKSLFVEFFSRYITRLGFLDGQVGLIESIYQALHRSIILTYLWELQNNAKQKFTY